MTTRFNANFTREIGDWLNTPEAGRSTEAGAMLLLRLTGNRVQYAAIMLHPEKYSGMVAYQLQKHYDYRVADLTLAELADMKGAADQRAATFGIDGSPATASETAATAAGFGKRADHDRLAPDIQVLYVENLEVRRKMQQLHLKIRTKYQELTDCKASDVYAFVRELLLLEDKYAANWERYDNAKPVNAD